MLKDSEAGIKADIKRIDAVIEAKQASPKDEKDKKADLQKDIDAFKADKAARWRHLSRSSVSRRCRPSGSEKEAYVADAYRMLTSRNLCTKCHQVGNFPRRRAGQARSTARFGPRANQAGMAHRMG